MFSLTTPLYTKTAFFSHVFDPRLSPEFQDLVSNFPINLLFLTESNCPNVLLECQEAKYIENNAYECDKRTETGQITLILCMHARGCLTPVDRKYRSHEYRAIMVSVQCGKLPVGGSLWSQII